jgi:hypothetical protein
VSELQRLAERELEDLLGARRERDVADDLGLASTDDPFDLSTCGLERDVRRREHLGCETLALMDQAEEDVLGPDVVVAEHPRLRLGEDHDAPGSIRESLEHRHPVPEADPRRVIKRRISE